MFKQRSRRGGFTLPEVLVTVAIVAVLAAAVVPTVVNQISKGEGASVAADFNALTQAVTQFITDTRQYPDSLKHLNTAITTNVNTGDLLGNDYSQRAVNAWKGPYLATTQALTATFTFSGFGLVADTELLAPSGNNGFITLDITAPTAHATLISIDAAIDGGDGSFDVNCASASSASTSGRFVWTETAGTPCVISDIKYRLVPTGGT
jgi:general secretion pathway protein G